MALRLGGHILAATWIALASSGARGTVRPVGVLLALLLGLHAFAAHWVPEWAIYPPFVLIPMGLTLVGRLLNRSGLGQS